MIIEKNKVAINWFMPFRLFINVRSSWVLMIRVNGVIKDVVREWDDQNDSWIIKINSIFIVINILIDGLIELNL